MHRIDTPDNYGGLFGEVVPNKPTQVDLTWMNAIQEELAKTVEGAGLTLAASGAADEAGGYASQLLLAIKKLNPLKAWAVVDLLCSAGAVTGANKVAGDGFTVSISSGNLVCTFGAPLAGPFAPISKQASPVAIASEPWLNPPSHYDGPGTYASFTLAPHGLGSFSGTFRVAVEVLG